MGEMTDPSATGVVGRAVVPEPGSAPTEPVAGGLSVNRTVALMSIARLGADNLRGGADRPLPEIAEQLKTAIQRPEFMQLLERRLTVSLAPELRAALFPTERPVEQVLTRLRTLASDIVDAAVPHFQAQRDSGKLKPTEMTLYNVFTFQKISKDLMASFATEFIAEPKRRLDLGGPIRLAMKDALQTTLALAGETVRDSPEQRQVALVGSLALKYLERPEEGEQGVRGAPARGLKAAKMGLSRPTISVYEAVRIGREGYQQEPGALLEFLVAVETFPRIPIVAKSSLRDAENIVTRRMQRAIAELVVRHPEDKIGDPHFQVLESLREIFSRREIRFHPYLSNNDAAVVDALYKGFSKGELALACASCPNYSGVVGTDAKNGKPQWQYDFAALGTGPGIVAERGLDFVKAWVDVLRPRFGDNLKVVHWEGTFEVATGFKSSLGDAHNLPYAEAVERLRQSGEAVRELYRGRGVEIESRLTHQSLPDDRFLIEKARIAQEVRELATSDRKTAELLNAIYEGRQGLYAFWYPMRDGENEVSYAERLKQEIVPENVAEYVLLGKILQGSGDPALVLAYDSPWMGEVYAQKRYPVISGQGVTAMGYLGA